ncbi:MAG: hypothetical protein LIP11_10440 [Clostridiales bacterium]|nr:hypothetical protein [Clostridiales bacterium]
MANIQHEDAIMKMGMEYFRDTLLKILNINYEYVDSGPTELVSLTVEKKYQDFTFLTTQGFYVHFEFQTTSGGSSDLRRFHAYEATMSYNTGRMVKTYVLYTGSYKKTRFELDCGEYTYKVIPIHMAKYKREDVFAVAARKTAQKEILNDEDFANLAMTPVMSGNIGKKETILTALSYIKNYQSESANRATAILFAFADKFLDVEELSEVKEMIYMTRLGQMLVDDGIEKGIEKGIEEGRAQENEDMRTLVRKLLDSNRMDDLKKATEDKAYCLQLKKELLI